MYCTGVNHAQQLNMLAQVHCKQWLQYRDVLHGTEVCGCAYFGVCVRIIVEQITGLSGTLHLDIYDFPRPNSFSVGFPGRGNFTNTIPGLYRRRGNPGHECRKQLAGGCINYLHRRIIAKVATADWYPLHRPYHCCPLMNTHTYKHLFNGPFSGTTHVSRYQKGKTNLDFTEARDSEWQWQQPGPILSVFPTLIVHSELKNVHPGFPVAFIF